MFRSTSKQKTLSLSYRLKDQTRCSVCNHTFNREQLRSGGGRLIAGKLNQDLRRTYEVSKKYGKVYPLVYVMYTCPNCYFSAFPADFNTVTPAEIPEIKKRTSARKTGVAKVCGPVSFNDDRNLVLGAASYLLAIDCYQLRGRQVAPTPKKAICSIRAAWLFNDMNDEFPHMGFDRLSDFFYTKAVHYYSETLEIMSTGREPHDQFTSLLGPDTDNNWGFDGVIYLNGYLTKRFLDLLAKDVPTKLELLDRSKRFLGKLYGMGKASKSKPSAIIDLSKDLYDEISQEIQALKGGLNPAP